MCPSYRRPCISETLNTCPLSVTLAVSGTVKVKKAGTYSVFSDRPVLVPAKTHLAYVRYILQDTANIPVQTNFLPRIREIFLFREDMAAISLRSSPEPIQRTQHGKLHLLIGTNKSRREDLKITSNIMST